MYVFFLQKVLACRKELVEYDAAQEGDRGSQASAARALPKPAAAAGGHGRCYGCVSAAVDHCITLLRALAHKKAVRMLLIKEVSV